MSDTRLRDLERAAAAGDDGAAARYIQERMRQGLDEDQVELLAYCLHPPAYMALGWEYVGEDFDHVVPMAVFRRPGQETLYMITKDLRGWSRGLRRWGNEAAMRAAIAAATEHYKEWEQVYDRFAGEHVLPIKKESVLNLLGQVTATLPRDLAVDRYWTRERGQRLLDHTVIARMDIIPGAVAAGLVPVFVAALGIYAYSKKGHDLGRALGDCGDPDVVLAAVRAELVPWVLGERQKGRP
jgi:hypothetical protein